jgi:ribosomal protein L1
LRQRQEQKQNKTKHIVHRKTQFLEAHFLTASQMASQLSEPNNHNAFRGIVNMPTGAKSHLQNLRQKT